MNILIIVSSICCCVVAFVIADNNGGYGKDVYSKGDGYGKEDRDGYGKGGGYEAGYGNGGDGDYGHGKHYDSKAKVDMKKKPYGFYYYLKESGQSYGGHGYIDSGSKY